MRVESPVRLLEAAVEAIIDRDLATARAAIESIDVEQLFELKADSHRRAKTASESEPRPTKSRGQEGRSVGAPDDRDIFRRDSYVCRYSHCRQATVDTTVLHLISAVLPDAFPYHSNWKLSETHILYWTHTPSFEHVVAWSRGGTNDESNLITACSCCNYAKGDVAIGHLGWELAAVPESGSWLGLTERVPELGEAVGVMTPAVDAPSLTTGAPITVPASRARAVAVDRLRSGDVVRMAMPGRTQRRRHIVLGVADGTLDVVEIWRSGGAWVRSANVHQLDAAHFDEFELLGHESDLTP